MRIVRGLTARRRPVCCECSVVGYSRVEMRFSGEKMGKQAQFDDLKGKV